MVREIPVTHSLALPQSLMLRGCLQRARTHALAAQDVVIPGMQFSSAQFAYIERPLWSLVWVCLDLVGWSVGRSVSWWKLNNKFRSRIVAQV